MTADDGTHETIIVSRPFDQVRPLCACGWQGTTCRSVADAELEADEHERVCLPDPTTLDGALYYTGQK